MSEHKQDTDTDETQADFTNAAEFLRWYFGPVPVRVNGQVIDLAVGGAQ